METEICTCDHFIGIYWNYDSNKCVEEELDRLCEDGEVYHNYTAECISEEMCVDEL
jgi:hypothetical protein